MGNRKGEDLRRRTKLFALKVIQFVESLPHSSKADIFGRQLLRSATSVGANYRSACRAKSKADFIAKLSIVEEEADESLYWFELMVESGLIQPVHVEELKEEANELISIIVASIKSARGFPRLPSPVLR